MRPTPWPASRSQGFQRIVALFQRNIHDLEGLAEKFSRRIIVLGGELCAGEAVVRGRNVEDRDRIARMLLADEADLHVDRRIGGGRSLDGERLPSREGQGEQARADEVAENHAAMMVRWQVAIKAGRPVPDQQRREGPL